MSVDTPLYRLDERPAPAKALLAGFQHVLASFVGIIAPSMIIAGALDLQGYVPYLISMALFVSGLATLLQSQRLGPLGSGLLSIQGTSFAFVGALIIAGQTARAGGADDTGVLATLFGVCLAGSLIEVALGSVLGQLKRIITPTVTGIVVTLIGLSLIEVGVTDMAGGFGAENFGSLANLGLGGLVIVTVLGCQLARHPWWRIGSIFIGLVVGCLVAALTGHMTLPALNDATWLSVPQPLRYGLNFDLAAFIPVAFIFLITAIETVGDLTGTSRASGEPVDGPLYRRRIRGGVMADGVNSALAAVLNTFPNTTFSQNTGVVQLTGVASRHVGWYVGGILIVLGLIPALGQLLQQIPRPVLGAATTLMFGLIAVSGIRILSQQTMDRKTLMTIATSLGTGLGVLLVPDVLSGLPPLAQKIFSSSITTGGLTAIACSLLLPSGEMRDTSTAPAATAGAEEPVD
ncbi:MULTISPECIES: nucleobase:cation symporter-2 family protein [unclassified Modicisalibacter]|uniref:uracil-xanthine permease family protein n=1 Tax=unclassified Modicisalibacter TaxID=2679913 RepID=UPI001CCB21E3|nr:MULTISPECIES: nucleobase:cation symporter-2 family protein [unclassified Modicisalibacter]MBZ9556928.1 purine permease [Modicisalibacter sp. R2A 31.J]MBZ9574359.1 purine permease [Modicisalibacter sp. MOD 31.J]